jgi:hypothetical protein
MSTSAQSDAPVPATVQSLQSLQPEKAPGVDQPASIGERLDLRDIHLPAEPGFWPPAPGWWLLFALLVAWAFWLARLGWRRYRQWRRRRRILGELDRLRARRLQGPALIAAVSALLKRVALSRYPRAEVAALTGEAWVAFLDRSGGDGRFARGAGRMLAEGAYAPAIAELDEQALLAIARDWLRRNS